MIRQEEAAAGAQQLDERYFVASSWTLMRRSFMRHRLALIGGVVLAVIYLLAIFADFFSVSGRDLRYPEHLYAPPTRVRVVHEGSLRAPFVYGLQVTRDPVTRAKVFTVDQQHIYPVRLFAAGYEYPLLGLIPARLHLLGVDEPGVLFPFGTDSLGRDMLARVLHGARISLSIGLVGVALSFLLGCLLGGLSGFFGGPVDMLVQRIIEFLQALPTIPLWMALAAAVPIEWPALRVYFMITVILSVIGWTGLARVVRGKLLQLRTEDYVTAAAIGGATPMTIILRHLLPGFMSYLIVSLTLAIPYMILGETALSFIGIGLRAPVVSWGVMLQQAQNVRTISLHPWLLIPGLFVVVVVLCFNFLGDGLRDAADPYRR